MDWGRYKTISQQFWEGGKEERKKRSAKKLENGNYQDDSKVKGAWCPSLPDLSLTPGICMVEREKRLIWVCPLMATQTLRYRTVRAHMPAHTTYMHSIYR